MQLTVRIVIFHLLSLNTVMATCTLEDQRRVQARFSNCTSEYSAEYSRVVESSKEDVEKLTCQLVEDIVEVCGDEWRECHDEEDVRRMKDMHVESLLNKNRRARVDIELCQVVRLFRSRHTMQQEDPELCTDEETVKSQEEFQSCTHSITGMINDAIPSLDSVKSVTILLCNAISNISSDCVEHLEKCLDSEDVSIMSKNHIEQLTAYFVILAGEKVDDDFNLENCQDSSNTSNLVDNTDMDNMSEGDTFEDPIQNKGHSELIVENESIEKETSMLEENEDKTVNMRQNEKEVLLRNNSKLKAEKKNLSSSGNFFQLNVYLVVLTCIKLFS